jgi:hypothetical protein
MAKSPDIRVQHGEERRLLLAALREPASIVRLPPRELDLTLRVARRARLLGRLARGVRDANLLSRLPQVAQDALVGAQAICDSRARVARWELNRIAWALRDETDLPLVALKGSAYLLADLPNAAGRLFADVDLLVPEETLPRVESRLAACGWRAAELTPYDENYYRVWTHELPPMTHVEREVEVDLHHNVLMRTARLRPDARLLLAEARRVEGSRFAVLAPVDMVLHAMAHLFYGGEMDDALRELVDIDDLLRHFAACEPGFWDRFWPRAMQLDLACPAFYGLRYAHGLLGTPVPSAVLEASRGAAPSGPVLSLMDRLVPEALFPQHPDAHRRRAVLARLALLARSHWVRMPPLLLARHLAYKLYVRHFGRGLPDSDQPAADAN